MVSIAAIILGTIIIMTPLQLYKDINRKIGGKEAPQDTSTYITKTNNSVIDILTKTRTQYTTLAEMSEKNEGISTANRTDYITLLSITTISILTAIIITTYIKRRVL